MRGLVELSGVLPDGGSRGSGPCVPVEPTTPHTLAFDLRLSTAAHIGVTTECSAYGTAECAGAPLSSSSATLLVGDTGGAWLHLVDDWATPPDAVSTLCLVGFSAPAGVDFDARVDRAELTVDGEIFTDGFESGDTTAWSGAVTP